MEDRRASFLVRVWQEPPAEEGEQPQWRASVEFIQTQEKHTFQDVESLIAFLQNVVEDFEDLEIEPQHAVA